MAGAPVTVIKCILIGDSGVGKSCLLKGFMGDPFDNMYTSTVGIDFEIKPMVIHGRNVHLQLWDCAGQERFRTVTTSYYRSGDAVIIAFDITEASTFKSLDIWYGDIQMYARSTVDCILVGTKADCEDRRQVPADAARAWASARGMPYVETSARTAQNVEHVFTLLASKALEQIDAAGGGGSGGGGMGGGGVDLMAPVDLAGGSGGSGDANKGGCC